MLPPGFFSIFSQPTLQGTNSIQENPLRHPQQLIASGEGNKKIPLHHLVGSCSGYLLIPNSHNPTRVADARNFCVNVKHLQIDLEDGTGLVRVILWRKQKECTDQCHLIDKCNGNCYIRVIGEVEVKRRIDKEKKTTTKICCGLRQPRTNENHTTTNLKHAGATKG